MAATSVEYKDDDGTITQQSGRERGGRGDF